jgi:ribonuclease H / adenosylcobalamin/alpha-ribazole phosphatase
VAPVSDAVLLLARHGHATSGPDHRWDRSDPLTETGLAQAEDLARHLASLEERPERLVVSPAVRACQTAAPAAAALGLEPEIDDRLLEFGSGAVSPYTLGEMLEHLPYDDIWHPEDPGYDGETIGAFWQRTAAAGDDLVAAGGRTLVVSHAGTTLGLLRWALGVDARAPDSFAIHVPNASLTTVHVRLDRHGRRRVYLRTIGESGYLGTRTSM